MTTVLTTVLALVVSTLGLLAASPAAAAAPATPGGLTAHGAVPLLAWDRVPGATGYDVQVSTTPDYARNLLGSRSTTVNDQLVPEVALPAGELHWRVRAKAGSTPGAWAEDRVAIGASDAPGIVAPAGEPVTQPDQPALLRWTRVPGAERYVVQIGDDDKFTDPKRYREHRTATLSHLVTDAQLPGTTYHWRVRADLGSGVLGEWAAGSYRVEGLGRPQLVAPVDDVAIPIEDVVLDWGPVTGAESYEVRVSADENFSSGVTSSATVATRWSPPATLVNDQYFWQVRPVDTLGTATPWEESTTWRFRRHWPQQPAPTYPSDGAEVADPLFLQWEPVRLASSYRVLISARSDFPAVPSTTVTCSTAATTLVVDPERCRLPQAGNEVYFWKVQGLDAPRGVVTDVISAPTRSFVYRPERATPTAPVDGGTVAVPTLRWTAAEGAEEYQVSWTPVAGGSTQTAVTTTTSFTPRARLSAGATYRWDVRTVSAGGHRGSSLAPEVQPTFTVSSAAQATAATPDPLDPVLEPGDRFPTLRWQPVDGADHYRLRLRAAGTTTYTTTPTRFGYPAGEESGADRLVPGTWFWQVEAWSRTSLLHVGTEGRFTIAASHQVRGHRAGPTGTATGSPATTCDMGLPDRCQDLDGTPVLRWDPVDGASAYRVRVTLDREGTTRLPVAPTTDFWATTPMWAHSALLPDQQAGSAYFVGVQACKVRDLLTCEPAQHAAHAFNKRSNPVRLAEPVDGAQVVDDVTFDWRGLLATNQDPALARDVTGVPTTVEAQQYEIEISTDQTFTDSLKRVDRAVVDQTTYTAPGVTLPEGANYWRVRAVDGSSNPLPWSDVRRVVKRSPRPVPLTPAPGSTVDGAQPLTWQSLPFAGAYEVRVLQGASSTPVSAASGTTQQTVLAPTTPLPAGDGYRWQVRRLDARSRAGEWSDPVPFEVARRAPRLQAPVEGEELPPSGALFSWAPEPDATTYRFQRRLGGSDSALESVTTRASAYAPVGRIAGGRHEWRVVALDATGKDLGASDWRGFAVQDRPTAAPPAITGTARVGTSLRAAEPIWSMPVDARSVQWLRSGTPIPGATGLQYDITVDDLRTTVSARFVATRQGYADGSVTTASVTVTSGAAPTLQGRLVIDGTPRLGSELSVDPPDWDMSGVVTAYQWLRAGVAVRGATTPTYTPTSAGDVDQEIAVRVTGRRTGYDDAVVTSAPIVVRTAAAPRALTPPGTTGSTRVGSTWSATNGEWSVEGLRFDHQWLRDGTAIPGADDSTYRLTTADAGRQVSVRVTASRPGYAPGAATSAARLVARLPSTTTASLSRSTARPRQPVQVPVGVSASGVTPGGAVTLVVNGREIASSQLRSGRTTLRYVPRSTGTFRLTVRYVGQGAVAASSSRVLSLRVRR